MNPLTPRAGASGNNYASHSLNRDSTPEASFWWLQAAPGSVLNLSFLQGLWEDGWGRGRGQAGEQGCCGCSGSGAVASTSEAPALPAAFRPCCGERRNPLKGETAQPLILRFSLFSKYKKPLGFSCFWWSVQPDGLGHVTAWWMGSKNPPSPQTATNLPEGTWGHGGVQVALCPCFMECAPAELVEAAHPGLSVHLSASLTAGNFPGLPCPDSRDERLPWW